MSTHTGAFLHGYGIFETIYALEGQLRLWNEHWERLERGASFYQLALPYSSEEVRATTLDLINKNDLAEARVRLAVSAESYTSDATLPSVLSISTSPYTRAHSPVSLRSVKAADVNCPLASHKSASYSSYMLANRIAKQERYDDALLINESGHLIECATSNLFLYQQGQWFTPDLSLQGLPGVQRASLINQFASLHIPLKVSALNHGGWEAGLVCNSLIGAAPISQIDDSVLDVTHPSLLELLSRLEIQ